MLLDRRLGDPQRVCDAGIGSPFGHEGEYLPLTRREDVEWVVSTARGYELLHERRIHHRRSLEDALERLDELVDIGYPALEQIAAPPATGQQSGRPLDLDVCGQRDDGRLGKLLAYRLGGFEALGCVRGRHADVDDHEIRPKLAHELEQLGGVARLTDDLEPGSREQAGETLAHENLVVRQHDPGPARAHSNDYGLT